YSQTFQKPRIGNTKMNQLSYDQRTAPKPSCICICNGFRFFSTIWRRHKIRDLKWEGKSVLVNAVRRGLGKAIAKEYVNQGANVLIGSSNEQNLQRPVRYIKEATGKENIAYPVCDIKKKEDITYLV